MGGLAAAEQAPDNWTSDLMHSSVDSTCPPELFGDRCCLLDGAVAFAYRAFFVVVVVAVVVERLEGFGHTVQRMDHWCWAHLGD